MAGEPIDHAGRLRLKRCHFVRGGSGADGSLESNFFHSADPGPSARACRLCTRAANSSIASSVSCSIKGCSCDPDRAVSMHALYLCRASATLWRSTRVSSSSNATSSRSPRRSGLLSITNCSLRRADASCGPEGRARPFRAQTAVSSRLPSAQTAHPTTLSLRWSCCCLAARASSICSLRAATCRRPDLIAPK